jgi:hypothetical protein
MLQGYTGLLQAALWVLRRRRPIDETIFQAATWSIKSDEISPEGALGDLVYALRALPERSGVSGIGCDSLVGT